MGVRIGLCPFAAHTIWWSAETFSLPTCFVCPSCRDNTAFEIVLRSAWRLLSHGKHVGRSSAPCRKWSQVWGRESEWQRKYMQQRHQNFEEQAQCSISVKQQLIKQIAMATYMQCNYISIFPIETWYQCDMQQFRISEEQ